MIKTVKTWEELEAACRDVSVSVIHLDLGTYYATKALLIAGEPKRITGAQQFNGNATFSNSDLSVGA